MNDSKVSYFLHGYLPETDDVKENVFCMRVNWIEFEQSKTVKIATGKEFRFPARLIVGASADVLEDGKEEYVHAFMLIAGTRVFLVKNDGGCQRPNGDIVWRWESNADTPEWRSCGLWKFLSARLQFDQLQVANKNIDFPELSKI